MKQTASDKRGPNDLLVQRFTELRPKLHRYCARMTGSAIDGEDVVQDAFATALEALAHTGAIANPEGWLFRIAHNTALDHLRKRARFNAAHSDEDLSMIADPAGDADRHQIASMSLQTFMRLPATQRSSVTLMDVLGYSLDEISGMTNSTVPAVKAALHRGRMRLRELAQEPDDLPQPTLPEPERALLITYVDRFNARDFDAIRDMLAEEVKAQLVSRTEMKGRREVGRYFSNYARTQDWSLSVGLVDRRPAVIVTNPAAPSGGPVNFMLLEWANDRLTTIRDFRYAPYVIAEAEVCRSTHPLL